MGNVLVRRSCRPQSLWTGLVAGRSWILRRRVMYRSMEIYSHHSPWKNVGRRIDQLYQQDSRRQSHVWSVASRAKDSDLKKSADATRVNKKLVDNSLRGIGLWITTQVLPLVGSPKPHRSPQNPTLGFSRGFVLRNEISLGSM